MGYYVKSKKTVLSFDLTQQDSLVYLDRGIAINKKDKFKPQLNTIIIRRQA